MKPEIKCFDCTDFDPIETYHFDDLNDVDYWINFTIGPTGFDGGDYFQVRVTTFSNVGLKESIQYCILLEHYSFSQVLARVNKILSQCEGQDWHEVATKISEYMRWEFHDYKPSNQ
ncbi:Imm8 family immunity protein [Motilimonas eburnea]|uniref:Imm8 family immunity protein n=1 Tax=Motilimonas eburnea TaxID=1737488 RepID=UPI001E56A875|nr:Imm8 family immunity protein [Motilimonas eburnea]MCE2570946.1 immunity 8 family protein [Motilimonas eburnea]